MILETIYPVRVADDCDFSDLTASVQVGPAFWHQDIVDALVVPMLPEPSVAEAAAIRRRIVTADADEEAHVKQLEADAASTSTPASVRGLIRAELARYGNQADLA